MEIIILKIFTLNFIGACITISVLMTTIKKLVGVISLETWWKRYINTLLPLCISSGIAVIPNVYSGKNYGERWIWGIVSVLFSHIVYNLIQKRFDSDNQILPSSLTDITDTQKELTTEPLNKEDKEDKEDKEELKFKKPKSDESKVDESISNTTFIKKKDNKESING